MVPPKPQRPRRPRLPPSHTATLDIRVRLLELPELPNMNTRGGMELCVLLHYLLKNGSGLEIGPECDGYLNLEPTPYPQAGESLSQENAGHDRCLSSFWIVECNLI